jgi:flagellar hook-associated protein 2
LRRELSQNLGNSVIKTLNDLGISAGADGKYLLDASKLDAVLGQNFDAIGQIFAGAEGMATRIDQFVTKQLENDGPLDSRIDGINDNIKRIAKTREALDLRMDAIKQRYIAQFTALDKLVSQLNNTGTFLAQQLANLPSPNDN